MVWPTLILTSLVLSLAPAVALSPHPKLILISFDGFRHDLLNATWTPNIHKWATRSSWFVSGSRSQYVTYTAPNHMSIVTGLHEDAHGIVSNYFYDTATGKRFITRRYVQSFDYFNSTQKQGVVNASLDASWYKADPIWLTNERFETTRRSATFYWPNGEAPFPFPPHKPSMYRQWVTYGNLSRWMSDVDEIVDMFTRNDNPVNFVAWYVAEPDHTLHTNGFYNGELRKIIHQLDEVFGYFVAKLHDSGLDKLVDVILTADHGHAEIGGPQNVMCLREYIATEGYELGDHMLYPHTEEIAQQLYRNLTSAVEKFGFKVKIYLKENIPPRLFYSNSTRIGRIVVEPEVGWAASFSKSCTRKKQNETYGSGKVKFNSSTHGMDPDREEMRAILVVGGPSIAPGEKIMEIPQNIDLYALMCFLLAISPSPNNSTMTLVSKALLKKATEFHPGAFTESFAFIFLIVPAICIVMLFMVYICRHTVLSDNPSWMLNEAGYRPLHMDIFDPERGTFSKNSSASEKRALNKDESSEDEF